MTSSISSTSCFAFFWKSSYILNLVFGSFSERAMRAFASRASSIFLRDFTRALMASSYSSKKSGSSSLSWRLLRAIFIYFGVLVFKRCGCQKRVPAMVTRFVFLLFGVVLFVLWLLVFIRIFCLFGVTVFWFPWLFDLWLLVFILLFGFGVVVVWFLR